MNINQTNTRGTGLFVDIRNEMHRNNAAILDGMAIWKKDASIELFDTSVPEAFDYLEKRVPMYFENLDRGQKIAFAEIVLLNSICSEILQRFQLDPDITEEYTPIVLMYRSRLLDIFVRTRTQIKEFIAEFIQKDLDLDVDTGFNTLLSTIMSFTRRLVDMYASELLIYVGEVYYMNEIANR